MRWGDPLDLADRAAWRTWLRENHESAREVFLLIFRDRSPMTGLRYDEAVEEALCFGWIDGIARKFDADRRLQRFTPRRLRSNWSESNRNRVRILAAAGRLEPAGLAALPTELREELGLGL